MSAFSLKNLSIPSETERLANGMRVVVHEDRSAPLVAVHLMYGVGSRHEQPGRTGLAHLLEHLLFEGTEHCAKGAFDTLLEGVGGSSNGSTWFDRTNYYETVPSHAAALPLWLERERLAFFLPAFDAEILELQRDVVLNERLESYENRPYGLADERLMQLLFPARHPYSWPTIGHTPDLLAITEGDVRTFFERFYTPENAVLVIAGDVDRARAAAQAQRYFGDLAAGPSAADPPRELAGDGGVAASDRMDILEDDVTFPRIYRAWSVPAYGTAAWTGLDVLAYLLADGESSRLQRILVRERQLAQEVETYLFPTQLCGVFGIVATARSEVATEWLAAGVDEALTTVAEKGVSDEEVAGAVRRIRRDQLSSLAHIEGRAEALAHGATVLGEANALNGVLNGYREVSPGDIVRAAEDLLDGSPTATILVVPRNGRRASG